MVFGLALHLVLMSKQKSEQKSFSESYKKALSPRHKFSKLFNRNTIKVSYSCMPNIKAKIHKHNKNILGKAQQKNPDTQLCNCASKKQCPYIPGYKEKVYFGVSETTHKVRYGNHKQLFTKQHHKNDTELSKEYWKVKQQNGTPRIKWKVLKKCHAYNQKKRLHLMLK